MVRLELAARLREARGHGTKVVVAGCVAQAEGREIIRRAPVVDVVVGPQNYHRLPELVARWGALGEEHGLLTCAYGHAGDGNLHAQVMFDDDSELPKVEWLLTRLFEVTLEMDGSTFDNGVQASGLQVGGSLYLRSGAAVRTIPFEREAPPESPEASATPESAQ